MTTDTERIDWLSDHNGFNLISDDGGRWAISTIGSQPVPEGKPKAMTIVSYVEAIEWRESIREAVDYAMVQEAQE